MANALIIVYASLGLVGVVLGIRAWRYAARSAARSGQVRLKRLRLAALIAGIALALGSVFLAPLFSYAVSTPEGPGRIVGWPFLAAFIDSKGHGYLGFLTYVGAFGNFIFWLLAPQVFLAAYARGVLSRNDV
jgi:hypothetical protein